MRHELSDKSESPRPFVEDASTHLAPSHQEMQSYFKINAKNSSNIAFLDMGDAASLYGKSGPSSGLERPSEQNGSHARTSLEAAQDFGHALANRAIGFIGSSSQMGAYVQERAQFIGNVSNSADDAVVGVALAVGNNAVKFITNPVESTSDAIKAGVKVAQETGKEIKAIVHDPVGEAAKAGKSIVGSLHDLGTMNQEQVAKLTGQAVVANSLPSFGHAFGKVAEAIGDAVEVEEGGALALAKRIVKDASGHEEIAKPGPVKKTVAEIKEAMDKAWEELRKQDGSKTIAARNIEASVPRVASGSAKELDWTVERFDKKHPQVAFGESDIMVYRPDKDKDLVHLL